MKSPEFDYVRPATLQEALKLLADGSRECVLMAGGQSLLTMMNFRMARPELVIDIGALGELGRLYQEGGLIRIGAGVTHAAIEDAALEGPVGHFLSHVASGIAFRAIRNRGTIGGSLAHADPCADWLTALSALGARAMLISRGGVRELPVTELVLGAMETALESGEIIAEILIPVASGPLGWRKSVRKPGEFAEALVAALPESKTITCWIGALGERPFAVTLEPDLSWLSSGERLTGHGPMRALADQIARSAPEASAHRRQLAAVAACDAIADVTGKVIAA